MLRLDQSLSPPLIFIKDLSPNVTVKPLICSHKVLFFLHEDRTNKTLHKDFGKYPLQTKQNVNRLLFYLWHFGLNFTNDFFHGVILQLKTTILQWSSCLDWNKIQVEQLGFTQPCSVLCCLKLVGKLQQWLCISLLAKLNVPVKFAPRAIVWHLCNRAKTLEQNKLLFIRSFIF